MKGSLFQRKDGKWVFQVYSGGKAKQFYGRTPEEAQQKASGWFPGWEPRMHGPRLPGHPILWPRDHRVDQDIARVRRETATRAARVLIREAIRAGWTEDYFARVIVAQLAPGRIRRGITGPCHYCGTWLAKSVDHVVPKSRGGTDDRDNLVSACFSCNASKRQRSIEEWRKSA